MLQRIFLAAALAGLTSCSLAPPEPGGPAARFHEGGAANLIVRFYAWNSMQIVRPDTRENGFLPLYDREGIVARLSQLRTGQYMAVVVLGPMYSKAQEQEIIREWHQIVAARSFQRLVLLRAGFKDQIDGLRVVYDSAMNQADAPPGFTRTVSGFAQIASPAGTDASHPSGAAIQ
jgi:hypothetical protein